MSDIDHFTVMKATEALCDCILSRTEKTHKGDPLSIADGLLKIAFSISYLADEVGDLTKAVHALRPSPDNLGDLAEAVSKLNSSQS